jgi:UDP-N-acetylmuramoyl-L-alanyl-D-glutamate--2,6-diaminopimelate ligase
VNELNKRSKYFQPKMDKILQKIKKYIPREIFDFFAPTYHYLLAVMGAVIYRFPSKNITVVAVTGTKGKSSTGEMLNAIFEASGKKTALLNTIRFKIGGNSVPNKRKMTVPGRFFVQKFIRDAVKAKCDVVILELSSEAAKQYRHKFIDLDGLVFTNLYPEHIESHGSFEKYKLAKLSIAEALKNSPKLRRILVVNEDDNESNAFVKIGPEESYSFSIKDAGLFNTDDGISFVYRNLTIKSPLRGVFNLYNMLGAATMTSAFGVSAENIKKGLENLSLIKGRVEFVYAEQSRGVKNPNQNFDVVVDYAHTSGSLSELYKTFHNKKKICVLGNTGGGRDKWKRPEMAKVADEYCDEVILTNEDPYDENPQKIIDDMLPGFTKHKVTVIINRREAIRTALHRATLVQDGNKNNTVVLITGKGTDPYIMGADGEKTPWSDEKVVREELEKILK